MANLLPEKKMQVVQAEFRDRFILAGALLLLASALFAGLMLLPSYLVLTMSEPAEIPTVQGRKDDTLTFNDLSRSQSLQREVDSVLAASSSPSKAIAQLVALRPRGITINGISYAVGQQGKAMTISGAGTSRDVINEYRDALRHNGFPIVSIPVSAIVGTSEGGGFTATLSTIY